ncbi:MAG: V-type ATP synthase subunit I [Clostridia bacterium]|nr:V-type ATP synthase subunit I [Clostridia bacterium]MBQ7751478.1 V-type ATP synthase subunit I [Clostridia bacterium]
MALTKMKRIEIVGLNSERKQLIEYLQRYGAVDISDSRSEELATRETAPTISQLESNMAQVASAISMLPKEKGGLFSKRTEADAEKSGLKQGETSQMMELVRKILQMKKSIEKNEDTISALETERDSLKKFASLDTSADTQKTRHTVARTGLLDGEWDAEKVWQKLAEYEITEAHFEILDATKQQTALWILYSRSEEGKMAKLFADLNFVSPKNMTDNEPQKRICEIEQIQQELAEENAELAKKIADYGEARSDLELFYDKMTVRRDKYRALENVGITKNAFFIDGYVPENEGEDLKLELLIRFTVSVELKEPQEDEDVPSAFKNNAFIAPVEGITSDYSMPSKNDIDPNPIMAIFYYFFFGMMFSDAGYGLLLMIVCGILGFGNILEKKKRNTFRMFFYCGVSTTFWGLMYGSFFGDMIATVSKTFGSGKLALSPILVDPVQKPLSVLIMSVAFGTIHILAALVIKFYMTWRSGEKWAAVFDTGFWILVISGVSVLATGTAFKIRIVTDIGKYMAIGGAIGLVLTQGRSSKNPIMKLLNGILSLYDITSIVGDVLSYSRLMALGLATGVIASVVNVLGSLGGNSVVGLISFIAISIFGHTLNFAINMLGAYVHTNRLQYVEFYQKFYEGGGRKYNPLGLNTKYYNFKNERNGDYV